MRFVEIILARDAKNYHAWQHRQWALKTFQLWENEMAFVERLLEDDIRNNSAWNQRHFVIVNTTRFTPEVLSAEVKYAQEAIRKTPHNESPWNYLRGILMQQLDQSKEPMFKYPGIQEFASDLLAAEEKLTDLPPEQKSSYLHSFRVDLLENELEHRQWEADVGGGEGGGGGGGEGGEIRQSKAAKLTEATKICEELAKEIDPIRKNYWEYFSRSLVSRYGEKITAERIC